MNKRSISFGIDYGSFYSYIGIWKDGEFKTNLTGDVAQRGIVSCCIMDGQQGFLFGQNAYKKEPDSFESCKKRLMDAIREKLDNATIDDSIAKAKLEVLRTLKYLMFMGVINEKWVEGGEDHYPSIDAVIVGAPADETDAGKEYRAIVTELAKKAAKHVNSKLTSLKSIVGYVHSLPGKNIIPINDIDKEEVVADAPEVFVEVMHESLLALSACEQAYRASWAETDIVLCIDIGDTTVDLAIFQGKDIPEWAKEYKNTMAILGVSILNDHVKAYRKKVAEDVINRLKIALDKAGYRGKQPTLDNIHTIKADIPNSCSELYDIACGLANKEFEKMENVRMAREALTGNRHAICSEPETTPCESCYKNSICDISKSKFGYFPTKKSLTQTGLFGLKDTTDCFSVDWVQSKNISKESPESPALKNFYLDGKGELYNFLKELKKYLDENKKSLARIYLVGGGSKVNLIKGIINRLNFTGPPTICPIEPAQGIVLTNSNAVAYGAALEADKLKHGYAYGIITDGISDDTKPYKIIPIGKIFKERKGFISKSQAPVCYNFGMGTEVVNPKTGAISVPVLRFKTDRVYPLDTVEKAAVIAKFDITYIKFEPLALDGGQRKAYFWMEEYDGITKLCYGDTKRIKGVGKKAKIVRQGFLVADKNEVNWSDVTQKKERAVTNKDARLSAFKQTNLIRFARKYLPLCLCLLITLVTLGMLVPMRTVFFDNGHRLLFLISVSVLGAGAAGFIVRIIHLLKKQPSYKGMFWRIWIYDVCPVAGLVLTLTLPVYFLLSGIWGIVW